MTENRVAVAEKLKQLLVDSSPLIEEYTSAVCPDCTDICCRQKHGMYRERDVLYLQSLGVSVPQRDAANPPEGPCEAMASQGCVHPRWMRPFKCTWYFCDPLLAAMNEGPQKKARRLNAVMQEIIGLYGGLADGEDVSYTRGHFPNGQTG